MPYHRLIVAAGNGRSAPVSLYAYATPQAPLACAVSPTSDYYFSLDLSLVILTQLRKVWYG
jgi:hypothetical protein